MSAQDRTEVPSHHRGHCQHSAAVVAQSKGVDWAIELRWPLLKRILDELKKRLLFMGMYINFR